MRTSGTEDYRTRAYVWLSEETNRTLLLVGLAALLGIGSLVSFFLSQGDEPSRVEIALLVASGAVFYYLALRSAQFR